MSVVLISLYHYDSFAMRLLFSYLQKHGIPVHYLSFKKMSQKPTSTLKNDYVELHDFHEPITESDINILLEQLTILKPTLIGMGLQSPHFQIGKNLTEKIKQKFNVPVIWGGSHPTIDPENCINHTDIVCVGEGFDALLELSKRIINKKPYDDVKNLWINRNGNIIKNGQRSLIENIDILPFANHTSENKTYIDRGTIQNDKNIDYFGFGFTDTPRITFYQTMTSFGCPMQCSFCINCLDHDKFRRRSVKNVIEELVAIKEKNKNLKMIFFWDNIFAVNKKWCLEFANEYKKKINVPFYAYSHPLFTDMEALIALREAGWVITVMGIQSGCYSLRKTLYDRNETNEIILEATQKLNKLKSVKSSKSYFRIYYDYVKNNPLEGKKELTESLDLFLKIPKGFIFQAFNLSFFPNYPITKYFLKNNIISEKDLEGSEHGTSANNWITTFDSKKEYHGFLRRHEYYYLLFSLAQYKAFPNSIIKMIERRKLFVNRLYVLYWLCRIVRMLELTARISNYAWLRDVITMIPFRDKIRNKTLVRYT